jgi:pilus assembly protein CpaF
VTAPSHLPAEPWADSRPGHLSRVDRLADAVDAVREELARTGSALTPAVVAAALRDRGRPVGDATVLAVHDLLRQDVLGAGPLEPLLRLPGVTDVLVNGCAAVYIDRGEGLEPTDTRFPDDAAVRRLAQRLASSVGRRLDDATPYVDLRLPDGTRFHAVLAPLSRPGTVISLRVPRARVFSLEELKDRGTVNADGAALLRRLVGSRLAFLVSGGTGSGKTTLLSALLSLVDPGHRMVVVEDASELRPDHPHVVGLESRPANVEGAGEVPMRVLVRQALRMRPDRLVVGEVRGAEVTDLLAALNTGHEGGCGTVHANSAGDVPARIEALAMAAGMPQVAVHSQLASAVDAVVHVARGAGGLRRLVEVAVLSRASDGLVSALPAVTFPDDGTTIEHPAAELLGRRLQR